MRSSGVAIDELPAGGIAPTVLMLVSRRHVDFGRLASGLCPGDS